MLQLVPPFARVVAEFGGVVVKQQLYSLAPQGGAQLVYVLCLGFKFIVGFALLVRLGAGVGNDDASSQGLEELCQLQNRLDRRLGGMRFVQCGAGVDAFRVQLVFRQQFARVLAHVGLEKVGGKFHARVSCLMRFPQRLFLACRPGSLSGKRNTGSRCSLRRKAWGHIPHYLCLVDPRSIH